MPTNSQHPSPHRHPNGRFFTPDAPRMANFRDVLKWWFRIGVAKKGATTDGANGYWPKWLNISPHTLPPRPVGGSHHFAATWINHSTMLVQTAEANFLFDPVFSRCCGPFGQFGPRRVHAPGIALDALPYIDVVFLSHDHYDHCDLPSLRRIVKRAPKGGAPYGITPLGNGVLLRRAGFLADRIIELDWWESCGIPNVKDGRITLVPSQHWSNRLTSARNSRLWGGFFITMPTGRNLYFTGDTGYHPTIFKEIKARLGSPDLALIPIGAYEPRWFMKPQHCNPAEAVKIHSELGSHQSVAMHWGTFRLTDEARDEPPRALAAELKAANPAISSEAFKVLEPGESLIV